MAATPTRSTSAAFEVQESADGQPYYPLPDVIAIGGKGGRAIERLQARAVRGRTPGELVLTLPARVPGPDDAPNFPGRKASVRLSLRDGRFREQAGARSSTSAAQPATGSGSGVGRPYR